MKDSYKFFGGMVFTFIIAFGGYSLSFLPFFHSLGLLASSILLAILYRQLFGFPEIWRSGIQFSSKILLRVAIILYGLKLNIDVIFQDGLPLLIRDGVVIFIAILFSIRLAKWLKADANISLLLGVGAGVCGAAAIAAVAPIVKSKDDDTALSVGMIALVGTIFSIAYTLLWPLLPLSDLEYGIWSGLSLHELAHVALAAEPAGEHALAVALLAKLGRVFLLVPLCLILIYWFKKKQGQPSQEKTSIPFPWFLVGFIFMSVCSSYVIGTYIEISTEVMEGVSSVTTWLLTSAMVGLGLNVSLKDVRTKALRPMLVLLIVSLCLSIGTYLIL